MDPAEFKTLRARIRETDEELALDLGVPVRCLEEWKSETRSISRYQERVLRYFADLGERARAVEESGLPECRWIAEYQAGGEPEDDDAAAADFERFQAHVASCETCLARERYAVERFGPDPTFPARWWMAFFKPLALLPESLLPAGLGAMLLAMIVAGRAVFAIPAMIADPRLALQLPITILAAAGAGASGGLVFAIVRPALRRLGRVGDYLTGIACVGAYMITLALVAPVAFGEALVEDRVGWFAVGLVTVLFGIVIGHSWFGPSKKPGTSGAP